MYGATSTTKGRILKVRRTRRRKPIPYIRTHNRLTIIFQYSVTRTACVVATRHRVGLGAVGPCVLSMALRGVGVWWAAAEAPVCCAVLLLSRALPCVAVLYGELSASSPARSVSGCRRRVVPRVHHVIGPGVQRLRLALAASAARRPRAVATHRRVR